MTPATPDGAMPWLEPVGPLLLLPATEDGALEGVLLHPALPDTGAIELFNRGGSVEIARLSLDTPAEPHPCPSWPRRRLAMGASNTARPWTVGLSAGRITPWPLDSIETLATRDSAQLAAAVTTIASRLPEDGPPELHGLRWVVLHLWRSRKTLPVAVGGTSDGVLIATLVRRLNQEDAPREERLLLVIETAGNDPRQWRAVWHEREDGEEDELPIVEPLLLFSLAEEPAPYLLLGRDDGALPAATLLTRQEREWVVGWESVPPPCQPVVAPPRRR